MTEMRVLAERLLQLANDEGTAQIHDVALELARLAPLYERRMAASQPPGPAQQTTLCAARKQALPEPADCNWPFCRCDPVANKVMDAITESGFELQPRSPAPATTGEGAPVAWRVRWKTGSERDREWQMWSYRNEQPAPNENQEMEALYAERRSPVAPEPGWLKPALDKAEQRASEMPDWMAGHSPAVCAAQPIAWREETFGSGNGWYYSEKSWGEDAQPLYAAPPEAEEIKQYWHERMDKAQERIAQLENLVEQQTAELAAYAGQNTNLRNDLVQMGMARDQAIAQVEGVKVRAPSNAQSCYDIGYANPAKSSRDFQWDHLVFVNSYRCGQIDRQNQAPRNWEYRSEDYDPETFERKPHSVEDPEIKRCSNCKIELQRGETSALCGVCAENYPALAAVRSATIEESAQVLDSAAQDWDRIRDPGMASNARHYAKSIRALHQSTEHRQEDK